MTGINELRWSSHSAFSGSSFCLWLWAFILTMVCVDRNCILRTTFSHSPMIEHNKQFSAWRREGGGERSYAVLLMGNEKILPRCFVRVETSFSNSPLHQGRRFYFGWGVEESQISKNSLLAHTHILSPQVGWTARWVNKHALLYLPLLPLVMSNGSPDFTFHLSHRPCLAFEVKQLSSHAPPLWVNRLTQ